MVPTTINMDETSPECQYYIKTKDFKELDKNY